MASKPPLPLQRRASVVETPLLPVPLTKISNCKQSPREYSGSLFAALIAGWDKRATPADSGKSVDFQLKMPGSDAHRLTVQIGLF
ncbi:hypothetical protein ACVWWG_009441 [Bradyrhizobium sp. LB7.2]|jgi:hypothetical protein